MARGDWNSVLTGRLDGWRAAVWMFERHPLAGVGQGAYQPEFVPAKLALLDRGVLFFPALTQVGGFGNAHNEILEAAADWGIPGLLALAWGLWVLAEGPAPDPGAAGPRPGLGGHGGPRRALPGRLPLPGGPGGLPGPALPELGAAAGGGGGMKGGTLAALLVLLLALALVGQAVRWRDRMTASRR